MRRIKFFAAAVIACFSLQSQAMLIELDGGGADVAVPFNNDFFFGVVPTYNVGGNLLATSLVDLTFTYLGHEAGYSNDFNAYGNTLNNKTNNIDDSFSVANVGAGLLAFEFSVVNPPGVVPNGISNGANMVFGSWQTFATILDITYKGVYYDAIVLFDDSGAGPDDDADDHIIGIRAVPEPSIIALFAAGLLGIGFTRRRMRK
jgi:hypothetical protein